MKRELAFAVLAVLSVWAILAPTKAHAAPTYTVNSTLDQVDDDVTDGVCHTAAGTCTLRAAVMTANRVTGPGATILVPAGTYLLTRPISGGDYDDSGNLNLATPVSGSPVITITGAGSALTIIDANQIDNVFRVETGRSANISDMTIRNGYTTVAGGAINNRGTFLTLTRVVVRDSECSDCGGGGIYSFGDMTLIDSVVRDNQAAYGGGILNELYGLGIYRSSVHANAADLVSGAGGGICNTQGNLTLVQSTVDGNSAGKGGGIYNASGYNVVLVTNSTISGNHARADGGGIFNYLEHDPINVSLLSSSIIGNEADSASVGSAAGGGIFTDDNNGISYTLALRNTLVAGNYLSGGGAYDDCSVSGAALNLHVAGLNLFWNIPASGGCRVSNPDFVATLNSLQLIGPLQDNGGPTFTHALLPGSNAIDAVDAAQCVGTDGAPLLTDQRGDPRVFGVRCDVGAFEYGDTIFRNGFE